VKTDIIESPLHISNDIYFRKDISEFRVNKSLKNKIRALSAVEAGRFVEKYIGYMPPDKIRRH
jgi:hypothetical protein